MDLLVVTNCFASLGSVRRAGRVDPTTAHREE
jgi:hypothetical protein